MVTKFCVGAFLCGVLTVPAVLCAADAKQSATPTASNLQSATSTPAAATDAKTDTTKVKGRLPSGWGKLGITDVQKQAIYKVEASYESQIDALHKQLADLEAKRDADMRNVLTAAQQKQLDDMTSARAAKKSAAADAKSNVPAASANSTKTSMNGANSGVAGSDATAKVAGTSK